MNEPNWSFSINWSLYYTLLVIFSVIFFWVICKRGALSQHSKFGLFCIILNKFDKNYVLESRLWNNYMTIWWNIIWNITGGLCVFFFFWVPTKFSCFKILVLWWMDLFGVQKFSKKPTRKIEEYFIQISALWSNSFKH